MARCGVCGKRRVVDEEGLCKECRGEYFRGATCCRCEISLTEDGYCPNDRCHFFTRHQDESPPDFDLPDEEEWQYIKEVILPRIGGQ
jgi:hypothetical protein